MRLQDTRRTFSTMLQPFALGALVIFGMNALPFTHVQANEPMPRNGAAEVTPKTAAAFAQPTTDSDLVTSDPADQSDITVYGNQFAQVQETRTVTLKAGRNRVQLNGVAARYRVDSLRLVSAKGTGTFAYRSATYQPANLFNEQLLAGSIGKQVKAWRYTTKQEVTGTLKSVNGTALVLVLADGKTELVNTNDVTLLDSPTGLSNTASLVVEADVSAAGDYQIDFLYETEGVTWSAKHSLIFDDEKSEVSSWEATVSLVNESGTSFKNATVRLLSGKVAGEDAPGGRGLYQAARAPMNDASESASVENVGDQKVYTLPGTLNMASGQTRQVPLFNGKNVPVKRTYVVGTATARYSADGKADAQIRLTVENCEKHHLGQPIPSGLVKVYQYNVAKKLQLTGSTRVSEKAQDEIFDLNIGTSSDVKWDVKLVEAVPVDGGDATVTPNKPKTSGGARAVQPTPVAQGDQAQFEDHTYQVTVYNYKRDRNVDVQVEVAVPVKQVLDATWTRPRADRANKTLTVPKSDKASVKYTIRQQVR